MAHQTHSKTALLEMFLDRTAGESYARDRLVTKETENGDVALLAYGWLKLAVYDEERDAVTVFTGHQSLRSRTVSRWLNNVVSVADNRGRDVILSGESPTVNTPNEGVKFIGNYVSMSGGHSPVEQEAVDTVEGSIEIPA